MHTATPADASNRCDLASASRASVCIGIGGGVGPAAGVILHKKIVENTVSDGTDQSHCEVHHISRPDVADRTAFLLGKGQVSPAVGMAKTMAALKDSVRRAGKRFVVAGVPCNTFHAPRIWDEFLGKLDAEGTARTVKMVHMLEETVGAIKAMLPGARKIGLLSTTGTRTSRVYHDLLEPQGLEVVQVDEAEQAGVHDAIYNTEWGVKAVQPTTLTAQAQFQAYAADLVAKGAEAIILGCTEIPLALPMAAFEGVPLVDPMVALARACIQKAGALVTELVVVDEVSSDDCAMSTARASTESVESVRARRVPVWQQHAAACVIQLAYRAYQWRMESGPAPQREVEMSRFGTLVTRSIPDIMASSPTNQVGASVGITPECFSRPSGTDTSAVHLRTQKTLQLAGTDVVVDEVMT